MSYLPSTDRAHETFFGFLAKRKFLSSSLGNRLVLQILAVSAALSVITSGVQLFVGYQQDRSGLAAISTTVESSLSSAFSDALWEYNFELAEALLDGVYDKKYVEHVVLTTPQGREWQIGDADPDHEISVLNFMYREAGNPPKVVGTLSIGISDKEVLRRLWEQAGVVLATNFLKACLVSIAISILFEWNVGRHLNKIARHVARSNWQDTDVRMELDRARRRRDEDIEIVVHAICSARMRAKADFALLQDEIELRKKTEHDLQLRKEELEQAYREQSEFTYAISHDMKSPTNTIKLLSSDLRDVLTDTMDEDVEEILDDIDTTSGRMSSLIDDVLHYASSVNETIETTSVCLDGLISEIIADLKSDIKSTQANIIAVDLPTLHGNRAQLRLLFQNLISNALKFRHTERSPEIRVAGHCKNGVVSIRVQDNGIGIAAEHFDRIFGMFKRLHAQSEFEGTGLGLTLCKRIVLNHNGTIEVSSEVGVGTTFELTFGGLKDV